MCSKLGGGEGVARSAERGRRSGAHYRLTRMIVSMLDGAPTKGSQLREASVPRGFGLAKRYGCSIRCWLSV